MPSMLCGFPSGVYDWPAYICLWCLFLGCALASNEVCIWLLSIYGLFALPKVGMCLVRFALFLWDKFLHSF